MCASEHRFDAFFGPSMGCGSSKKVVPKEDTDLGWVPGEKTKKKKGKSVTIVEPHEEPVETLTMEQIESEADHAIAKARALMTGLSPRPDDLHNAAIVVVEDDDDMFETVELDSATLGHATTSDAARLADEAARHAQRAGYYRCQMVTSRCSSGAGTTWSSRMPEQRRGLLRTRRRRSGRNEEKKEAKEREKPRRRRPRSRRRRRGQRSSGRRRETRRWRRQHERGGGDDGVAVAEEMLTRME